MAHLLGTDSPEGEAEEDTWAQKSHRIINKAEGHSQKPIWIDFPKVNYIVNAICKSMEFLLKLQNRVILERYKFYVCFSLLSLGKNLCNPGYPSQIIILPQHPRTKI